MLQLLRPLVPQQNRKHLEVDHALQQLPDPLQQVVQIQDARDLPRNLIQHGQASAPAATPAYTAAHSQPQSPSATPSAPAAAVLLREVPHMLRLQIDHADHAILHNQRHRKLRLLTFGFASM